MERAATSPSAVTEALWLDPTIKYALRRLSVTSAGKLLYQQDVVYADAVAYGLVPSQWTYSEFDSAGKVTKSEKYNVTDSRINIMVGDDRFNLNFPARTLVSDLRSIAKGAAEPIQHIVKEDGSTRPVDSDELGRGATPDMLLSTAPGEAGLVVSAGWQWLVVVNIVLFTLLVVYLAVRYIVRQNKGL